MHHEGAAGRTSVVQERPAETSRDDKARITVGPERKKPRLKRRSWPGFSRAPDHGVVVASNYSVIRLGSVTHCFMECGRTMSADCRLITSLGRCLMTTGACEEASLGTLLESMRSQGEPGYSCADGCGQWLKERRQIVSNYGGTN